MQKSPKLFKALFELFQVCFDGCMIPSQWYKTNIKLIPKASTNEQGDVLSPTLFSVYVYDLAFQMKSCKLGDDLIVRILLYADDIILLAE